MDVYALGLDLNRFSLPPQARAAVRQSGLVVDLWPVSTAVKPGVLAVTRTGLHTFTTEGETAYSWAVVTDLRIGGEGLSFRTGPDQALQTFGFLYPAHADEVSLLLGSIPSIEVHSGPEAPAPGTPRPTAPRPAFSPSPSAPVPTRGTRHRPASGSSAATEARRLFWVALVLQISGGILTSMFWPHSEINFLDQTVVDSGDAAVASIGVALTSFGVGTMLLVIIAWGVDLGMRIRHGE